jgi:hypothetical protein
MVMGRLLAGLLTLLCLLAPAARAANVVLLVRVGTDANGNPLFRAANESDSHLSAMASVIEKSTAVNEASRYYSAVQEDKITQVTEGNSSPGEASAAKEGPVHPTFVEFTNGAGGSYNDWTGSFSVQESDGSLRTYTQPRIVMPLGGDVVKSGNMGLIVQTIVHEMGHGSMCQAYRTNARKGLPKSSSLGKPHSGGSVSDPQLAFIEGWAEFIGTYFTARTTIAEDPKGSIDRNWYAQGSSGTLKSPQDLLACEGWAATLLYKISVAGKNENAMWKMTQVMSRTSPQSMPGLLTNVAATFPELVPTIDQKLNELSGGQIANLAALQALSPQDGPPISVASQINPRAQAPAKGGSRASMTAGQLLASAKKVDYQSTPSTVPVPAAPVTSQQEVPLSGAYPLLMDAIKDGNAHRIETALERQREEQGRRTVLRRDGPRSER